jgi:hypothetical protein
LPIYFIPEALISKKAFSPYFMACYLSKPHNFLE